jgi:hypothetical protein
MFHWRHTKWLCVLKWMLWSSAQGCTGVICKESHARYMYICKHICIHSFRGCYTRFDAYPNYIQIKIFVKATYKCFERKKPAQIGTNVRARVFNAELLARSQFASGRFQRPANSIKVFRGFSWSQGKCWADTQIPCCTACFSCSPPNGKIKNFALMYPSWCRNEIPS